MPPRRQRMNSAAIEELIAQRVAAALATYVANRNSVAGGTGGGGTSGTNNGDQETNARGCSYKEFLNCKPQQFKGTEGAVGLIRWFEKLESVFRISNCTEACKVKYATCTLQDGALTWWNSYAQSVGIDTAYELPWEDLKRMMKDEYCPRNEIQKLEVEFWNLVVKGNDIAGYTNRFHELALLCPNMVTPEDKKIERYIWGLTPPIQGMVTSSKTTTIQDTIRLAHDLMSQVVRQDAQVEKNTTTQNSNGKRKWEENSERNVGQQQNKRPETVKAYTAGPNDKKGYVGNKPLCNKCIRHHFGPCDRLVNCFECGEAGHFRNDCPKLNNV